jgi:uncharacterized iron-regulated membrane protein
VRKLFFWAHLIVGTTAAIVIFIMSVTGVLLMYERQTIEWADRHYRSSRNGDRLAPEALLRTVANQTGTSPDSLTLRSDPAAPVELALGPKIVYADAYSGRVLGEGSTRVRRFFRAVTDWHRWLALEGPKRQLGRTITGAANLMFLGLALSGMYLWLPRKWSTNSVRAVIWFRGGLSGKARDFNWHNAIGIWSAIPLVGVILGALVISYPWATNLVYRVAGSEAPAPARPAAPPASKQAVVMTGLDAAWRQAQQRVPAWQSIAWRASGGNRISLAVMESHRGRVDLRSTVIVDRATGEVLEHEQFSSYNRGRQWRLWLRFIHTGEALGVAGQTVAGIVSAGAVVLVWTGLALSWRRFRAWRARRLTAGGSSSGEESYTRDPASIS